MNRSKQRKVMSVKAPKRVLDQIFCPLAEEFLAQKSKGSFTVEGVKAIKSKVAFPAFLAWYLEEGIKQIPSIKKGQAFLSFKLNQAHDHHRKVKTTKRKGEGSLTVSELDQANAYLLKNPYLGMSCFALQQAHQAFVSLGQAYVLDLSGINGEVELSSFIVELLPTLALFAKSEGVVFDEMSTQERENFFSKALAFAFQKRTFSSDEFIKDVTVSTSCPYANPFAILSRTVFNRAADGSVSISKEARKGAMLAFVYEQVERTYQHPVRRACNFIDQKIERALQA